MMAESSQHKPFVKIPLRLILIVPFVVQIILIVGWVGYLSFRNGQEAVNNVAHQLRSEISARIEQHLRTFLSTPHQINQINANAIRQGLANDPAYLERYLWEQVQVFDSVTSVYFANTQGGIVDAGREGAEGSFYVIVTDGFKSGPFRKYATDNQGNRTELLTTIPDFDARTRSWYSGAIASDGAVWSEIYILFSGQDMALAASRPVFDEQSKLLGVISNDIFVSHISNFLKNLKIGETGSSFIMERSGLLVASSMDEKPFTGSDADQSQKRLYASESAVPVIRYSAQFLRERFGDYENITGELQNFEFEIDGQRQFLQVSNVQDEYGIDWLVVVVIPEADFMAQINAGNRTTILLVALALVIAIIVGVIATQWITWPISRLVASTQALAQGEWNQEIREGWISEISDLTRAFKDMAGQLKKTLQGLTSEIAERRRTVRALRESEERLALTLEGAELGTWDWNVPTGEVFFNERWAEILGYTLDEIEPHVSSWEKLMYPDEVQEVMEVLNDHLEGRTPIYQTEHRLRSKSGEWRWILDTGKVFERDEQGNPVRAVGTHQDITERKQAEEALRESEERFRSVYSQSPIAIELYDAGGLLTDLNPACLDLFGITDVRAVKGFSLFEDPNVPEDAKQRLLAGKAVNYQAVFDFELVKEMNLYATMKSGRCYLDCFITPWITGKDAPSGFLVHVQDITERKKAEEELRQSKLRLEEAMAELRETQEQMMHQERLAAVGQLAAGIAHDFNNILASIVLYTQMLLYTGELAPKIRNRLDVIAGQADRATELVQQILDFSRRAVLERRPLAVNSFLKEVVKLLQHTLPESVQVELIIQPGDYTIQVDPTRLQQAIVNLALNARDAMPDGGTLHITLCRVEGAVINCVDCGRVEGGKWVQVEARDSGTGIAPDVLPHIFEPFFTTRAPLGHGLGLAQIYGIVKQHGGHIEVVTEIGVGTAFRLYWPASLMAQPEAKAQARSDAIKGKGQTILVVEDDATMRTTLVEVMDMLGYKVLAAVNGREALDVCERHMDEITLILTDWVMPLMSGLELVRELEARKMAVKVLVLTGYPLDLEAQKVGLESIVGWVLKPPNLDQLSEAVARALEGA